MRARLPKKTAVSAGGRKSGEKKNFHTMGQTGMSAPPFGKAAHICGEMEYGGGGGAIAPRAANRPA